MESEVYNGRKFEWFTDEDENGKLAYLDVSYDAEHDVPINHELDNYIKAKFEKQGWEFDGSGYCFLDGRRDLHFLKDV